MQTLNFSEARKTLKSVFDRVAQDADITIITRRDAPDTVVMSLDHYNSLIETFHLLKTPANAAHLARSIELLRSGKTKVHELIDDEGMQ